MHKVIIKNWNSIVKENDIFYILGDISWYPEEKTVELIKQVKGHKGLIKGNHDKIKEKLKTCFKEINNYKENKIEQKKIILSKYKNHLYN